SRTRAPRRSRTRRCARDASTRTPAWAGARSPPREVVEAAAERHRVARRIDDRKARLPALNGADARERHAQLAGERVDFPAPLAWRGEEQLVVVAAGEHAVLFELRIAQLREGGEPRDVGIVHQGPHMRALEDVLQVARQPIRYVDRGARETAQALAELDARLGLVEPRRGRGDLGMGQSERRGA